MVAIWMPPTASWAREPVVLVASPSDAADRSGSYTFAGQNFGEDYTGRTLIAVIALFGTGSVALPQTSVTIGGIAATGNDNGHGWNTSPWFGAVGVGMWAAKNVVGTSGSVVVNFTNTATAAGMFLFSASEISSVAHFDDVPAGTLSDHGTNPNVSDTIDVPAGGLLLGGLGENNTSAITLTGITKRHEMTVDGHLFAAGYDYRLPAQTGRTIGYSATGNQVWASQFMTFSV